MDIEQLYTVDAHEAGADVVIRNPLTGEDTDIVITIKGIDSKAFRQARLNVRRKALEGMRDGSDADADAVASEILAKITIGWTGLTSKGEPVPFSEKTALELYKNAPPIREQIDEFISNRINFIKG